MTVNATTPLTLTHPTAPIALEGLVPAPILADSESQPHAIVLHTTLELLATTTHQVQARAVLRNNSDQPVAVTGFRWSHQAAQGQPAALRFPPWMRPHYYACENYRGDYFGTGTTEGDHFFYPLTNQFIEVGNSEESQFPGIFIFCPTESFGLLVAQMTQQRFHPIFRSKGQIMAQDRWFFELEERVGGGIALTLQPGETLVGETWLFLMTETRDPQLAAREYFRLVNPADLSERWDSNPLAEQRIYCSWNYDFMADIDAEKMLGQIPLLKKHFPSARFLQLDDGYQTEHNPGQRAMIDFCYGDLEHPFSTARFPQGPKAYCDQVRAQGLRPAIWLGLWASQGSQMLKDHPDWVLHDDTGAPLVFSGWYGGTVILDPSVDGVRDYLHRMAKTVFQDWGFEGVKLDFSNFAFNMKRARFSGRRMSGVELRHELETLFRQYLPTDGFFGWCVVCGTAQPFLARADYFRCAVDIGHGDWPTARRIAFWCANTNMLLQSRPCLPNMDSIGWSPNFNENGWQTWLNLCVVNGGALEISGDLRKLDAQRLKRLGRTMQLSDPRRLVRCLDLTAGPMAQPPSLWLATAPDGSGQLGIFNWADDAATISLDHEALRELAGPFRDVWSGRAVFARGLPRRLRLAGQSSRLIAFNAT